MIFVIQKTLLICQSGKLYPTQFWLNFTWSLAERIFVRGVGAVFLFNVNLNCQKLYQTWVNISLNLNLRMIKTSIVFSVLLYSLFVLLIHGVKLTLIGIIKSQLGIRAYVRIQKLIIQLLLSVNIVIILNDINV